MNSGEGFARNEAKMATVPRFLEDPEGHFFLFGPRGTGKSTWIGMAYPGALLVDLLAPAVERRFQARPERLAELIAAHPEAEVVVVDEVQKVPKLLDVVHQLVEASPSPRFVLTGSSSRKLKRAGVDLLAGRALLRSMPPFMAGELGGAFDLELALRNGMLPVVWDSARPADTLAAYVALYVKEEVQTEGMVRSIPDFSRFLEAVSFSQAAILNTSEVARECEVSRKTVEGYIGILEDLLLSWRLPVFSKRAQRRVAAHPKFYWFDCGVFRSLRPSGPLDRAEEIAGAALEGLVAQHLRAWIDLTDPSISLSFWRTTSGTEVDFVVYGPEEFCAIEVKHSSSVRSRDLRALKSFGEDYPEAKLRLVYRGNERLERDGVLCLPCEEYLGRLIPGSELP
jgi:predicted AAA+ superfamily ATPase